MSGPGPRLRVGIGLVTAEVPPGSQLSAAGEYADTPRIAERAEELGFDSLWTSERLHYLLKWADPAEREDRVQAFETDPDWRAVLTAQPGLTGRGYNELWRPTGYSPLTQAVWPDGAVD
jgi:alkanesulfonate monooxygenase SsuD/methylene tetrahydromethanopterin reductase-like flavin-dependent oxidoreductase (luciferase family)